MTEKPPARQGVSAAVVIIAVVALVIAALALFAIVRHASNESGAPGSPPVTAPPGASAGPSSPATGSRATTQGQPTPDGFAYQPLWPFGGVADAVAWQREANPGGHQPWHLDAGLIAQMFTQQYLGYTNVDKIVKTDVRGEQAWVSVGFANPNGQSATAAIVHLVQIGTGSDRPWEVVGTEDSTLSLTTPGYGSTVRAPVTVGGRITGVDESLRVQIRALGHQQPVGEAPPTAAGGTNSPWSVTVPFSGACPGALTVAVATGGHAAGVERFAITGVRC
ncbi:Gmad2 immunoglobulin-like domain-containing protein [Nocardia pseudobrasiliensis]|uniref:Uncharacterized protein n=1 Tax=Nocardia pseudobrasiliensis TaxID=45979 RepID=A0A370IC35_9NOCA|nr:Gmad2 immunoglobulin-like domain-containing protein [Nocardia pseudobrasiliensis]RDI68295.1 hypothetical protein DFR76_102696 [Nocardia pseudobrasiliensis]